MDQLQKKVKLMSIDIIPWIQENFGNRVFYNSDLVEHYHITKQSASGRLRRLNSWGYTKFRATRKRGYGGYRLTELGKKY